MESPYRCTQPRKQLYLISLHDCNVGYWKDFIIFLFFLFYFLFFLNTEDAITEILWQYLKYFHWSSDILGNTQFSYSI